MAFKNFGNSGGKKGRSGRKSKAAEMGLAELLSHAWPPEQRHTFILKLVALAEAGNLEAGKLLLAYTYGRPPEHINLQGEAVTVNVKYVEGNPYGIGKKIL